MEIDRHFICGRVLSKKICLIFIPTNQQLADILTKRLAKELFECIFSKLSMIDIFAQTEGELEVTGILISVCLF